MHWNFICKYLHPFRGISHWIISHGTAKNSPIFKSQTLSKLKLQKYFLLFTFYSVKSSLSGEPDYQRLRDTIIDCSDIFTRQVFKTKINQFFRYFFKFKNIKGNWLWQCLRFCLCWRTYFMLYQELPSYCR